MNAVQNEVLYDNYRVRRRIEGERRCANCRTNKTKAWRKNFQGRFVCNSCGLYERHFRVPRPRSLWKKASQTRQKKTYSGVIYARMLPNVDYLIESIPLDNRPESPPIKESSEEQEVPFPYYSPQDFLRQLVQNLDYNENLKKQVSQQMAAPITAPMTSPCTQQLKPEGVTKNVTSRNAN